MLLNWVATCSIKNYMQKLHASLLGYLVAENPQTLGLVLEPVFSHQKGRVYMSQHAATKMLVEENLNLDQHFMLLLDAKSDARDGRPSIYPGKIAVKLTLKDAEFKFRFCDLYRLGRTEMAEMLRAKDMVAPEEGVHDNASEEILPSENQDGTHIGPRGAWAGQSKPWTGLGLAG